MVGQGQPRSRDELPVNGLVLHFVFFIQRVLVTGYFENRCVKCFYPSVEINLQGKQSPKIWEFYANLLFFFDFVSFS